MSHLKRCARDCTHRPRARGGEAGVDLSCSIFGWFTVDRDGGAFYWSDDKIEVCDLMTFQSLGTITVPVTTFPHPATRRERSGVRSAAKETGR